MTIKVYFMVLLQGPLVPLGTFGVPLDTFG